MATTIQDSFTEDSESFVPLQDHQFMSNSWSFLRGNVASVTSPPSVYQILILSNVGRSTRDGGTADMLYLTDSVFASNTDVTVSTKLRVDGDLADVAKKSYVALVIGGNSDQNGYYYGGLMGDQFEIGYYNGSTNVTLKSFPIGNQQNIFNEQYEVSFSMFYKDSNSTHMVLSFDGPTFNGSLVFNDNDASTHIKGNRVGLYYLKTWGDIDNFRASFTPVSASNFGEISFPSSLSETIVSSVRKLNTVIADNAFSTNNFAMIGGKKLRQYALNQSYYTIAAYIDSSPTVFNGDSAIIDGKVFDINKSGSRNAYCLSVNNTNGLAEPCRYMKIDSISLPANASGDIIFAKAPSGDIEAEETIYWMGRPMRFVRISGEWVFVINQ